MNIQNELSVISIFHSLECNKQTVIDLFFFKFGISLHPLTLILLFHQTLEFLPSDECLYNSLDLQQKESFSSYRTNATLIYCCPHAIIENKRQTGLITLSIKTSRFNEKTNNLSAGCDIVFA